MNRFLRSTIESLIISNTKLLFPLNNIFQQKFNMTTPNNFLNAYNSFSFPISFNSLPLTPGQSLGFNPQMRLLQQQYAYPYMIPQNFLGITSFQPRLNTFHNPILSTPIFTTNLRNQENGGEVQNKN